MSAWINSWCRMAAVLAVLVAVIGWTEHARSAGAAEAAGRKKQPPGQIVADPFAPPGNAADPFGAAGAQVDPAQRRKAAADELLKRTAYSVWEHMQKSTDDAAVLDSGLSLLQAGVWGQCSAEDVLAKLARQPWMKFGDESARDVVEQLDALADRRRDPAQASLDSYRRQAAKWDLAPDRFDWRTRREDWLQFMELIVATRRGEDTGPRWRQAAAARENLAAWYRIAHLLAITAIPPGKLDFEFVQPLFATPRADGSDIRWAAEALTAMLLIGTDPDDPARLETRTRLMTALKDRRVVHPPSSNAEALAELYRMAGGTREPEAVLLLEVAVQGFRGLDFHTFASRVGFSARVQRDLQIAKLVKLPAETGTLATALRWLVHRTSVQVWIDPRVLDEGGKLPVAAAEGPWLTVLERVLGDTPYQVRLLAADLFWIGPADRWETARQTYRSNLDKIRWADTNPASNLLDLTRIEFVQTPLDQVAAFLADQHDVNLTVLGNHAAPVTVELHNLPLHLALTLMAEPLGCDWFSERGMIFLGPRETIARLEQQTMARLQRSARLGIGSNGVARALRSNTRLEFIETPLDQVAGFLSDVHRVPLRVAQPAGQVRLTLNLKDISLEQALDAICWKQGLTWDTDGQTIEIH